MKALWQLALAATALGSVAVSDARTAAAQQTAPIWTQTTNQNWLLEAPNDTERWRRLQFVFRGTDIPMWEVAYRYEMVYEALAFANYDMAVYQWEKIREAVRGAVLKRPNRRPNAEAMFLDTTWDAVAREFKTKDAAKAWSGFELARSSCMACHEAEKLGFMNQQALFERTASPPKAR